MNIDICKKCLNSNCIEFFYYDLYDYQLNKRLFFITIKSYPFNICKLKNYKMFATEEEVIEIINSNRAKDYIFIDKSCPYYIEHQMNNWNKI